jgi:hypothetical protein
MVNIMDINIIDLDGNIYDINSMHIQGNDVVNIVIKKSTESFISHRKARELVDDHLGEKPI